jgi:hypothetical protein
MPNENFTQYPIPKISLGSPKNILPVTKWRHILHCISQWWKLANNIFGTINQKIIFQISVTLSYFDKIIKSDFLDYFLYLGVEKLKCNVFVFWPWMKLQQQMAHNGGYEGKKKISITRK